MKHIKYLFLTVLYTAFFSCSNENEAPHPQELTTDYFDQSAWDVTYNITTTYDGITNIYEYEASFVFDSDSTGVFTITDPEEERPRYTSFKYSVDRKKIHIRENSDLGGFVLRRNWWMVYMDANRLNLTDSPDGHSEYLLDMYLTRVY